MIFLAGEEDAWATDTGSRLSGVREDFDPLSAEFLADPYAVLASLPVQEMPVFYALRGDRKSVV